MTEAVLTERQKKWFASVKANFETATGRPLADWVTIIQATPASTPRTRAAWLKAEHGVGQNHAAYILDAAFPSSGMGWDDPEALRSSLWADPASLAILEAVERVASGSDGVISGQRKGYTSFSRAVQFAAIRPLRGGKALLGLKLSPDASPRLSPTVRRESWSERLSAVIELSSPSDVDAEIGDLFAQAADNG